MEQVLRVKFVADTGGYTAQVVGATADIKQFGTAAREAVGGTGTGTAELRAGVAGVAAEIRKARADTVAFLASSQIQNLTEDFNQFGNIVAASVAGRAVHSLGEFASATATSILQQNLARNAALENAAALTAQYRAQAANYTATVAAGTASAAYTAALRAQLAASLAATVAARAQAASLATGALSRGLSLLGGPVGVAAIAAAGLAYFALSSKSAGDEADAAAAKNDKLSASLTKITAQSLAAKIVANQDVIKGIAGRSPVVAAELQRQIVEYEKKIKADFDSQQRLQSVIDKIVGKNPEKADTKVSKVTPLKDGFDQSTKALDDFQKTLASVNDALLDNYAKVTLTEAEYFRYTLATRGLNAEQIAAAGRIDDVTRAMIANKDEAGKLAALLDTIFPDAALGRKYAEEYLFLTAAMTKAGASAKELAAAQKQLGLNFVGSPDAKADVAKADVAKAEELSSLYAGVAASIRGSFRDTFRDVLDGGVKSFSSLGDRVVDIFKDTLAEMATLALARQIIVPTVLGVAGAAGVGQQAQTGLATQLGATGATAVNPLLGAAVIGGAFLLQAFQSGREADAERAKQIAETRKAFVALARDIALEVRAITSDLSSGQQEFQKYSAAIREAGIAVSKSRGLDRVAAERALSDAIQSRYELEKNALNDIVGSIKGVAKEAAALRGSLVSSARDVLGLDDFRAGTAIKQAASLARGPVTAPDSLAYTNVRDDESRLRRVDALLTKLYGIDPTRRKTGPSGLELKEIDPNIYNILTTVGFKAARDANNRAIDENATDLPRQRDAYLKALGDFSDSAAKNVGALSDLREESLRWYDAQKTIAAGLKTTSDSIGGVLESISVGAKTPGDRLKYLLDKFNGTDRSVGNGTDAQKADRLSAIGQSLVAQSGPLLALARELYASSGGYTSIEELVKSILTEQKSAIDAATPDLQNVQAQTLSILGTIDVSLGSVKDSLNETLTTLKDTIGEIGAQTVAALNLILGKIGDTTGSEQTVAAINELGDKLQGSAWGPQTIAALNQIETVIAGTAFGPQTIAALDKLELAIANGGSQVNVLAGLAEIVNTLKSAPGTSETVKALTDLSTAIANGAPIEIAVVNNIDGTAVTNAVVTTINGRITNGETVFAAPPGSSGRGGTQGGGRYGGGM